MNILFTDAETRCAVDISEVGLANYITHPSCRVNLLSWAVDTGSLHTEFPLTGTVSPELDSCLQNPDFLIVAHNAAFERNAFKYLLGYDLPIFRFRDTAVLARSMSMPGSLQDVCEILNFPEDEAKLKDGKKLIKLFCEANGQAGRETLYGVSDGFSDPREYPDQWQRFIEYNQRDISSMRKIWYLLLPFCFPDDQWQDWFLSEEMNEFGMPVNVERARKALHLAEMYVRESRERLNLLTGLENANSRDQLLSWLTPRGYSWNSIEKKYIEFELNNAQSKLTAEAREVLQLRLKSRQNSYTKLEKLLQFVSPDGRLRHQFVYGGAPRTFRWSSFGVQVQNFPRPIKKVAKILKTEPQRVFDWIDREAYEEICTEFTGDGSQKEREISPLSFVASILRNLFEVAN